MYKLAIELRVLLSRFLKKNRFSKPVNKLRMNKYYLFHGLKKICFLKILSFATALLRPIVLNHLLNLFIKIFNLSL